jgi:ribosomal protein S6--L-glutamate ligase
MTDPFALGWEEWAAFPGLGLPAIKAKVDTGARTSALHAVSVEPFGPEKRLQVRFVMHPIPDQPEVEVICAAPVVDRREVTSSNGETELRWVIETPVRIGERKWPIEVTLTNRESMNYRMLLGRTAIQPDMVVQPTVSCAQNSLSFDLYKGFPRRTPVKRPLRIAILTREPKNYSSQRLKAAAEARGHVAEMINTARCTMAINTLSPAIYYDGRKLAKYDAVIPRIGASMTNYGMAVLRQFQMTGAFILNAPAAIGASRDKLYAHQVLARAGIGMPATAFAHSPKDTRNLIDHVGGAPLDEVPGIGPARKRALLRHFGSAKAVSRAGLTDPFEEHRRQLLVCPLCQSKGRKENEKPCDCPDKPHLTDYRRALEAKEKDPRYISQVTLPSSSSWMT